MGSSPAPITNPRQTPARRSSEAIAPTAEDKPSRLAPLFNQWKRKESVKMIAKPKSGVNARKRGSLYRSLLPGPWSRDAAV
jgi:hypothetical protein